MIKKSLLISLILYSTSLFALVVGDAVIDGRVENGNLISDRDTSPDVPAFGNVQGSGNVTISWSEVNTDSDGSPITVYYYEIRYRAVGAAEYTVINVPNQFTGHALTLPTDTYEGYIEAIADDGYISTVTTLNFEVL